jgi:uncharacterized protein
MESTGACKNNKVYKQKSLKRKRMSTWKIKEFKKLKAKNPILIEGLPGMGNVGKIAVDYLIDAYDAEKIYEFNSNEIPHCVFINEDNLVELPKISLYHKRIKGKSILFLAGDIQPISESSCFDFCSTVLDTFKKGKGKEIITLGGVALPKIPKNPKVYCTGNSKKIIEKYKSKTVNTQIHGTVGPIVGVSGLLAGLAGQKNIPAITLLAETFGHPNYIGIKGARNILKILKTKLSLDIELSDLEEEVNEIEQEITKKTKKLSKIGKIAQKQQQVNFPQEMEDQIEGKETNYIG